MAGLYLIAATLLLTRLGEHPPFAYNWEAYTAFGLFTFWDRPTFGILRERGGLMTDSSVSPLVILPGWFAFKLGDVGLLSLRVATALQAAAAVPLLWWTGRKFVGAGAALLAACLLALSPVFLLYGRTATLVGLSLGPALVTIEAIRRVLRRPDDRHWLYLLQAGLIAGGYGYAPVRFLWPLALLFMALEHRRRPAAWAAMRHALVVSIFVPWVAISLLSLRDPLTALFTYYEGRGEHVLGLSFETRQYGSYIRADPDEELGRNPLALAARLVAQNGRDLAALLLDRDTAPALTDYWNAHGRLYPGLLAPFLAGGVVLATLGARRRVEDRLLLALAVVWTLPMVATSKVHIGRLIFFLPVLCLLVASGAARPVGALAARVVARWRPGRAVVAGRVAAALLALLLLTRVATESLRDYREVPGPPPGAAAVPLLRDAAAGAPGGIAVIARPRLESDPTDGIGEATEIAAMRLHLDATYRFVSLYPPESRRQPVGRDGPPPLYYGDILGRLGSPTEAAIPCDVVFFVAPFALDNFLAVTAGHRARCGDLRQVALP